MATQSHYFIDHADNLFRITSYEPNGPNTYGIEKIEKRIKSFDFELHSPKIDHNQPINLPLELVDNILYFLTLAYLKNQDYQLANRILTLFSKNFSRRMYITIFDSFPPLNPIEISYRFSTTLHFIRQIHENVLNQPINPYVNFFKLVFYANNQKHIEPWHIFANFPEPLEHLMVAVVEPISPPTTTSIANEEWNIFQTGDSLGDGVWLDGEISENGLFVAERMLWPVIVVDIQSGRGENLCSKREFKNSVGWKGFNSLFRLLYGPTACVFYVVKPQGGLFPKLIQDILDPPPIIEEAEY